MLVGMFSLFYDAKSVVVVVVVAVVVVEHEHLSLSTYFTNKH